MDFGIGAVGVEVGRRLAEYGAEVIKIESRAYPDFMRTVTGGEFSPSFVSSSRSKLGFGANAKTPEGHDVLMKLAEHSDVVIENNSTGTMDDLGLGFDDLLAVNPNIVMVSSQLMGSHGTWADWRGYGPTGQGPGGLLHLWNYADRDDPAGSASIYPDHYAGCLGAVACAGRARRSRPRHRSRGRTWRSRRWRRWRARSPISSPPRRVAPGSVVPSGNRSEQGAPWGLYPCAGEEQWVAITCRDDADWQAAARARWASPTGRPTSLFDTGASRLANAADCSTSASPSGRAPTHKDDDRAAVPGTAACPRRRCSPAPTWGRTRTTWRASSRSGSTSRCSGEMVLDGAAFHGDVHGRPRRAGRARRSASTPAQLAIELLGLDDAEVDKLLATGVLETTPPATDAKGETAG